MPIMHSAISWLVSWPFLALVSVVMFWNRLRLRAWVMAIPPYTRLVLWFCIMGGLAVAVYFLKGLPNV